jgi:hypothetical protein
MTCDCAKYQPISLDRKSINRRIKESPAIRKKLSPVADNDTLRICLFRCPECGQLWQSGHEWNFGDREYVFRVPPIDVSEWQREPYAQPAAMMIHSASMHMFFTRNKFEQGDAPCRTEGCNKRAVRLSVFCLDHHVSALQRQGMLARKPIGRLFPPYFAVPEQRG